MVVHYQNGNIIEENIFLKFDERNEKILGIKFPHSQLLERGYCELEKIPKISNGNLEIYYVQQGTTLYLISNNIEQSFTSIYIIEQEIRNGKVKIKEVYSSLIIDDNNVLLKYCNFVTANEPGNIKENVCNLFKMLPFLGEVEAYYMYNSLNDFFSNKVQEEIDNEEVTEDETDLQDEENGSFQKKYYYNGERITTQEIADESGLSLATVFRKLKTGATPEEIIKTSKKVKVGVIEEPKDGKKRTFIYLGNSVTLDELAEMSGLQRNTIWARIKNGMTVEEAITLPLGEKRAKKYEYCGQEFTLQELSELSGVSEATITERFKRGWTVEQAVETSTRKEKQVLNYRGETLTLQQLSELSGLPVSTIHSRLERGWTVEDAVEKPVRENWRSRNRTNK